ncbi:MAG: DUF2520 domain-containing protein [Bacteroidetes bacterium]|nr:MAG: DUF2520 domain-containing protein [Bacteroidota bacterium]REK08056.1 MAG: DUF2520 domain-containing protein [Bacteroidota bacterium]REK32261.1 MAG: DUF2520 domain-containing protein [Bacteroidota bacterium]REK47413.1 MAG: DUF2520 domain-containing protein [Bacteroidota bacterium]
MKVVLAGAGNVANHLGPALQKSGHDILQVIGRSESLVKSLAKKLRTSHGCTFNDIRTDADAIILMVRDDSVKEYARLIPSGEFTIMHTSGAVSAGVFENKFANYGVLYPVQTFSKTEKVKMNDVPFCIEGSNKTSLNKIRKLISPVSEKIYQINEDDRKFIHISAVFASNFSNHMYTIADTLLKSRKINFEILKPLISQTAEKIKHISPKKAQTGPASRGDSGTVSNHLKWLKGQDEFREIYALLSKSIQNLNGPVL